VALY